jgi:hypothetical protein
MKTWFRLTLLLLCIAFATAVGATNPIPVPNSDLSNISVDQFMDMKYSTYKQVTGKKGKFTDRVNFLATKKFLRYQLNNENIESNSDYYAAADGFSFRWGAFFLGLFLNILGILFVLLLYSKPRKDAVISWLIGFIIGSGGLGAFFR